MQTRDGVRLDADVYRPDAAGPFPVLLMRQPYGRKIACTVCYAHPDWYAARGFIVVIQDVRGRGTSAGAFSVFLADAEDGADTVAWAATLPGSSGVVGMYGFSYQGTNQFLAAGERPPALRALAPAMLGWDIRNDWAYEGGAFGLQGGMGWAIQLAAQSAHHAGDADAYAALVALAGNLPLAGGARPATIERYRALTHYHDWIDQPEDGPYWRRISPAAHEARIREGGVPALLIGGWFDSHLPGTLAAMRALIGHLPLRLVVGPWAHFPWGRRTGGLDFSEAAIGEIDQLQVAWFDHHLKGAPPPPGPATRLFDMGALCWRDFPEWPAEGRVFYLAGEGRAALDERDGALLAEAPADRDTEALVHDPWRPVPSLPLAQDRTAIDARPDVLTFTTAPATEPVLFAGDVRAVLDIAADAPDFDVSCTLSRVTPDGRSVGLAGGHGRRSTPGLAEIAMRATCLTLQPGERLRLSVAGAAFPAFPVNPGTGQNPTGARAIDARVITLRLRHGSRLHVGAV